MTRNVLILIYDLPVECSYEPRIRKVPATDRAVVECCEVTAIGQLLSYEMKHVRR